MVSSFEGAVLDPSKCNKLSIDEKRNLVYEISKWSNVAPEMLQSWSRQEILQILCAEMGKERKYTGLTKLKIIEHLLKIVSEKKSEEHDTRVLGQPSSTIAVHRMPKRHRQPDHPSQLLVSANDLSMSSGNSDLANGICCKNSACKASLTREDVFCKRCSCFICHKFDDNKDPSLWLTCSLEPPVQVHSCNMSFHLECFLGHEACHIERSGQGAGLDGIFYCASCGKANDFLSCWRKQLMIAKDTRRVDILCYRLSLSQKLLAATKSYRNLSEIVNEAANKLEAEVGPLTGSPVKMGRGIVNRLSSGQEVQRLCASAVELLDSMITDSRLHQLASPHVQGNHENQADRYFDYYKDAGKTVSTHLSVVPAGRNESLIFVSDEEHARRKNCSTDQFDVLKLEDKQALEGQSGATSMDNGTNTAIRPTPYVGPVTDLPITPCPMETLDRPGRIVLPQSSIGDLEKGYGKDNEPGVRSVLKKRRSGDEECAGNDVSDEEFKECVKMIRWLECKGHIEKSFRQKFLTWYSMRAPPREERVVKVFVDTLSDDPASLAEQLVDTFGEIVSCKRTSVVPAGLCLKLWH
ncbi:hypothetical protein Nepgr_005005 [Nepenthes gracilis]|uniref:Oberon PHD finger domain-containing protein n=1 Tax=Nepenthes gracilis TaxID=150966 RepID=A0AAD3XG32_NEPGR|nr:hypothetical protein Nepgr_005005 [Nepenthes gracilis]